MARLVGIAPRRLPLLFPLLIAFVVLSMFLAPAAVQAQDPGSIGLYFDPFGQESAGFAVPLVPFDYYVVAFDLGDIFGYELSVIQDTALITVLSRIMLPPEALDVGPGPDNWIVGTGVCLPGGGPQALITMQGLLFVELSDLLICLGPADPSTPALGGGPGWLHCDETLETFTLAQIGGAYPDGCGVLNPTLECLPTLEDLPFTPRDTQSPVGTTVVVPVEMAPVVVDNCDPPGKTTIVPPLIEVVSVTLTWDPLFATLLSMAPGAEFATYDVTTNDIGDGTATFALSHHDPEGIGYHSAWDPATLLDLEFQVGDDDGFTLITVDQVYVEDWNGFPIPEARGQVGVLSTVPVANAQTSFGSLKARYDD